MNNNIIKNIIKISILTLFIIGIFYGIKKLNVENKIEVNENKEIFIDSKNDVLSNVAIAIATNIGLKYDKVSSFKSSIYKEIVSLDDLKDNKNNSNDILISHNMILIGEYLNILKTDIKKLLDSKDGNRENILNTFISGLELRYKSGVLSQNTLIQQKDLLLSEIEKINNQIENLKQVINTDFSKRDSKKTLDNINTYLILRNKYTIARTYIIYINQFLYQYNFLNEYNKFILDTLINNKDSIIKNSYVVIPDSGSELLKKLNLLYDEQEFKKEFNILNENNEN